MTSSVEEFYYRNLAKVEDGLTTLHYRIVKPIIDKHEGVDIALTKSRIERVRLITNLLMKAGGKDITEIRFAAGGDGDLDEFADALFLSGIILSDEVVHVVRVVSTPKGPAPNHVRNAWKGVEFIGIRLPAKPDAEYDFTTDLSPLERECYAVFAPHAIERLRESSPEAANWFTQNLPEDLLVLSFGADEVEVV